MDRRRFLHRALFGAGGVGLTALATGLPRSILTAPLASEYAHAQPATKRKLILVSSSLGDPVNANVPGTYGPGLENIVHPPAAEMAPTALTLSGTATTAAKPWADLPQAFLDRTAFIHHGTYINTHPNHRKTLRLSGGTNRNEMLVSVFAKDLAAHFGTTQAEPISIGARNAGELLSFDGRTLAAIRPSTLKGVLSAPDTGVGRLEELRDRAVDRVWALYRTEGTAAQRRTIDRFVQTRDEARSISTTLLDRLDAISGNDADNQVLAAPILAAMNVAPVITINLPFGRDNHADTDLAAETAQTISGVAQLQQLAGNIASLTSEGALSSEVVLATLNVFGRTLSVDRKGTNGRDHNSRHHCMVIHGPSIRGGIVGGLERVGTDWGARGFDSATGTPNDSGDVPYADTFGAAAKTLGRALGVDDGTLETEILQGRPVASVLRP